jgi:hypothetical protein
VRDKIQKWLDAEEKLKEMEQKTEWLKNDMLSEDIRARAFRFNRDLYNFESTLQKNFEREFSYTLFPKTYRYYDRIESASIHKDHFTLDLVYVDGSDRDGDRDIYTWSIDLPFDETLDGKYLERAKKRVSKLWGIRTVEYQRTRLARKQEEVDRLTKELAEAHAKMKA